ncbi:phage terminase small subunit [Nocardia sp. NPDC004260]
MPQPKKHPSVRARANRASTAAVLTDGRTVIRPDLPEREEGWHPQTVQWWNDLWAAPMAAEYHPSDKHALFLLAVLMDQFWVKPSQSLAAEIRQQRQAFGLTPYDRRRLEWTIESAEQAKDRGEARRHSQSSVQPAKGDDPRLALVQ